MNSVDDRTRGISLTYKRIHECLVLITIIDLSQSIFIDKFSTYIIIDSIFYVAFEDFVRGGGIVFSTRSRVGVCGSEDKCSTSSGGATPSSIKTIDFVRSTTILFDVLVFTILIGKAPQKCFT